MKVPLAVYTVKISSITDRKIIYRARRDFN